MCGRQERIAGALLLGLLILASGCQIDGLDGPVSPPAQLPESPDVVRASDDVRPVSDPLSESGYFDFVAPLTDGRFVAREGDFIRVYTTDGTAPVTLVPTFEVGEPTAAFEAGNAILIAGTNDIVGVSGETVFRAPLRDALGSEVLLGVYPVPDTPLSEQWLLTATRLLRWLNGNLETVNLPQLDPARLQVLPTRQQSGESRRIWLIQDEQLFSLWSGDEGFVLVADEVAPQVRSFALSADGALWVVSVEGHLHRRDAQGFWSVVRGIEDAERILGRGGSVGLWLQTASRWVYLEGLSMHVVSDMPLAQPVTVGWNGQLIQHGDASQAPFGLRPRHHLTFVGLDDGDEILSPRTVSFSIESADQIQSMTVRLGGLEVPVDTSTLALAVDPESLFGGIGQLEVEVRFTDGTLPITTSRSYVIRGEPPSWTTDVQPIAALYCDECHGAIGAQSGARTLQTRESWIANYDEILSNVTSGNMPKSPRQPLSSADIARIVAWANNGYVE